MNAPQPREQFEAELRRQRLPRTYIERLLAEWDDHLADLQDERNTDMAGTPDIVKLEERLGNPAQLAALAAKQYHHRSFLGRHPILTFLVLPLPLVFIGILTVVLATFLFGYALSFFVPDSVMYDHPFAEYLTGAVFFWFLIVLPPLGASLFLCRVARRNAIGWRWTAVACAVIAFYCSELFVTWNISSTEQAQQHARMAVGIMFLPPFTGASWGCFLLHFLPQFLLAMAVGLLLIKRAQRLQKIDESRAEAAMYRQAA